MTSRDVEAIFGRPQNV